MRRVIVLIDSLPHPARQLARFIVTGGVNTVFGYMIYAFFAGVIDLGYRPALVLSYVFGVPFSYATFRAFVFTGGDRSLRTFAKFLPTYGVIFCVDAGSLHVLIESWGWNKLLAQAGVVPFCAALSFLINRMFVFRDRSA